MIEIERKKLDLFQSMGNEQGRPGYDLSFPDEPPRFYK
jgi:hypothetical protein